MERRPGLLLRVAHVVGPLVSAAMLALFWSRTPGPFAVFLIGTVLAATVVAAVHHAEVISARVGEPLGALILALSVTVIEVGIIVAIITSSSGTASTLARDTVFAAIMITCNGIIGLSIVAATFRGGTVTFNSEGAGAALGAIATIGTLSLVIPTFTRSSVGPTLTLPQLAFAAVAALGVYLLFLYVLTVRHREHFQDPSSEVLVPGSERPSASEALRSLVLLVLALGAVVGLAKVLAPSIQSAVRSAGLPQFVVAVVIALVVLLPESVAAVRAARRGDFQTSVNLGYGSAMASIGLTIPAMAVVSVVSSVTLELGLNSTELVLFVLTMLVSGITVASPRTTLLQGGLHLAIFAAFLTLAIAP